MSHDSRLSRRGTALRLLGLATATATLGALALPAANASTKAPLTRAQLIAKATHGETHQLRGLHRVSNSTVTSSNWSGYAATGSSGQFTSVSSSWTQPSVNCSGGDTYSSFWVGIDGYNNQALEQTGTEADCVGGQAVYDAWWEVLPAAETVYNNDNVSPGDHLSASVKDNGNGTFTMSLTDSTRGWTATHTAAGSSGYQDSSAEVIAEAPYSGGVLPLADFGTVNFSGSTASGQSLSNFSTNEIVLQNPNSGDIEAQPSSLSGGSFSDTWENSN